MPKQQRFISPEVAEYPPGHWSNCIRVGDTVYLSGFTARANDLKTIHGVGDAYEQAKVIFAKIRHCLEAAGARMSAAPRARSITSAASMAKAIRS